MEVCFISTFVLFFSAPILLPYQNIKKYDDQMEFIFFFFKRGVDPSKDKSTLEMAFYEKITYGW